jgi:outer membrane protein
MLGSTRLKRMVVLLCSLLLFPAGCVSDLRREEPPQQGLWPSPISPEPMGEQQPAPGAEPDTEESGPPAPAGPLILSVKESVLLALENNRALSVERLNPSIVQTFEAEERAVFDPSVDAETTVSREKAEQTITGLPVTRTNIIDRFDAVLGVSQFLPTGTEVRGELSTDYLNSDLGSEQQLSRMGLSVTQALLEGRGVSVNLARLRQARLDTRASQYELRAVAEFLVAQVEQTYWDYALARRQIEIFEETLRLAEQQRAETEELINVGRLPESELAAAQAEIALSRQNLINARSRLATTRLQLLRLLNPSGPGLWQREIDIVDKPTQPQADLAEPESHVALALRMRPELNQARLSVLRDELEVVRTRNGLLPVMDLFITLGKTGYADSFGSSVRQIASDDTYDILGGLRFEYPLFNRRDRALHQRAVLGLEPGAVGHGGCAFGAHRGQANQGADRGDSRHSVFSRRDLAGGDGEIPCGAVDQFSGEPGQARPCRQSNCRDRGGDRLPEGPGGAVSSGGLAARTPGHRCSRRRACPPFRASLR